MQLTVTNARQATGFGFAAILLWGTSIGLIRHVTESLGVIGGAAAIYTVAGIILLLVTGYASLWNLPKRYMLVGSLLFVVYEVCFSVSIGLANSRSQVIEVGMINYLWPSLTTVLAIWMNGQRAKWWIVIGLCFALVGVVIVISGNDGISLARLLENIRSNPLSYALAAIGAVVWAFYCNVTKKYAQGKNGVTLFTLLTAVALWLMQWGTSQPPVTLDMHGFLILLLSGISMGAAYGLWNIGILNGNLVLLATASYFTPVLSTLFTAIILHIALTFSFLQGVFCVTIGSIICWLATKRQ